MQRSLLDSNPIIGRSIILPISVLLDYSYVENTYCGGEDMEGYRTFKDAILACNQNNECGVITDYECDGYCWTTCRGNHLESSSSRKSCSLVRPQIGKFRDFEITSGLIIIYDHNKNIRIDIYVYLSFYVPLIRRL